MKQKVLFILHYPPPLHGAAMVGGYIKESQSINENFDCRFINLGTSSDVNEIGKNNARKIFLFASILANTFWSLIYFRPDLCYITPYAFGKGFYKDFTVIAIIKLFRIKTIFHYHNKGIKTRQYNKSDNFLYRIAFKKTQVIILSPLLFDDINKFVPESRIFYCANGIPDCDMRVENNLRLKKADNTDVNVRLLFLSNLIRSKGIFELLEACKILKAKKLSFHLTIIGSKGDVDLSLFNEKIFDLGLNNFISYIGKKIGLEKEKALFETDIFVHPTLDDCMPLVLIEAMNHSLPIVSTNEGAIPEMVDDGITGFLVNPGDIVILAQKLEELITNRDLRLKMGEAGRLKYENNYTLKHFENRILDILKVVLEVKTLV